MVRRCSRSGRFDGFYVGANLPLPVLDGTGAHYHAHRSSQARADRLVGRCGPVGRSNCKAVLDRLIADWIGGENYLLRRRRIADADRGLFFAAAARSRVANMSRVLVSLFGLLTYSTLVQAKTISPRDFAYGQSAIPARDAAAYRFALPLTVYQDTFREDLGDLRVFNAEGVVVPFSLSRPAAQTLVHTAPVAVSLFPLHEGARILIDGVHLTINSAGSAVDLQTQNGTPLNTIVRQYFLDARSLDATLSAMQLGWLEGAPEYTGRVNVEVSDDLTAWHSLTVAPIANLRANSQTLIENRVEFAPTKAKFWRLSWLGMAPNFELTDVLAEPAASLTEPDRASLDVGGVADPKNPREYTFDLGGHPPVSRVNILLPEANSVIDVELSSRLAANAPWRVIIHSGFYRLKMPDAAEQQNASLEVSPDTDRYWRARILGAGNSPQSPPGLHVEWVPNEVTFLAQGHAPFLMAYGNASANRAEADLSRLPNSLAIAPATLGPAQVSGGMARLIAKAAPFPRRRVVLWSVLLLAVAVLAWMAYRIAKDPEKNPQG